MWNSEILLIYLPYLVHKHKYLKTIQSSFLPVDHANNSVVSDGSVDYLCRVFVTNFPRCLPNFYFLLEADVYERGIFTTFI